MVENLFVHEAQALTAAAAAAAAAAKSLQSCPTLCDPIDGSPSGSSVPEILQARTLEWVAISFSRFKLYSLLYLVTLVKSDSFMGKCFIPVRCFSINIFVCLFSYLAVLGLSCGM